VRAITVAAIDRIVAFVAVDRVIAFGRRTARHCQCHQRCIVVDPAVDKIVTVATNKVVSLSSRP
jgi:hypothetical protein